MRSDRKLPPRPQHGGRLLQAARQQGIPVERWLDLSTGINPWPYPVPTLPPESWMRLPEPDDGLKSAAAACYGCDVEHLLPVAGSQAAIQALPHVLEGQRISILGATYAEHAWAWHLRQARVMPNDQLEEAVDSSDIVIVVNPDNPTRRLIDTGRMCSAHRALASRGGWLVVDEAFMDPTPDASMASSTGQPGLIVLRSLGKFFGLAGARVGFVLGPHEICQRLDERLGPWTIAGPSRVVARTALLDVAWQEKTHATLRHASLGLAGLLRDYGLGTPEGCALFQQVATDMAPAFSECLARHGILLRQFDAPRRLRFGLPGGEEAWQRLVAALVVCSVHQGT